VAGQFLGGVVPRSLKQCWKGEEGLNVCLTIFRNHCFMTLCLFIPCKIVSVRIYLSNGVGGHLISVKILPLLVFNPILNFHPFLFVYDLMMNWENMYQSLLAICHFIFTKPHAYDFYIYKYHSWGRADILDFKIN